MRLGLKLLIEPINKKEKLIYWRRPVYNCFKLNTDGSFNNLNAGCGGIIRDHKGMVVMAYAGSSPGTNALQAEIDNLLYGIQLCLSLGINNIWVEVDALLLIQYVNGYSMNNPNIFYKIWDIKNCLSRINFSISHILHEGNAVADGLAKLGCAMNDFLLFNDNSLPREIKGLTKLDRLGLPYMRI
ncbi:Putative ribonuclease H protein [Dendrobium catenatum]|uniref:Ribonuclease H protein n=1 Tax=Dendrobium catenatum TaxID=906689 RepID=A0A2I0WA46_9ASPA|nr:Putative ribonuclease H protein [Dendrobium catenatum]